jgi:hypothetical protein
MKIKTKQSFLHMSIMDDGKVALSGLYRREMEAQPKIEQQPKGQSSFELVANQRHFRMESSLMTLLKSYEFDK